MNMIQRTSIIALSLFVAISGLAGCQEAEYKVIGDNKKDIEQYAESRDRALVYLNKTLAYVGEVRDMKSRLAGVALQDQNKKMLDLKTEGDALIKAFAPLSHCRGAGEKAQAYWTTVAASKSPEVDLIAYVEEAKACQAQINVGPKPLAYLETAAGKAAPFEGCSKLAGGNAEGKIQNWSCPAELLSKK
ncbi:MAG: hypothetical protein ACN6QH_20965 [Pseudomonas sp.]|uniref:hypothetical protein n=1 Tax=Pseudomonas sp. TaxID=306 RepID=UPI003D14B2A5